MKKGEKRNRTNGGKEKHDLIFYAKDTPYDVILKRATSIDKSNLLSQMKFNVYFKPLKGS